MEKHQVEGLKKKVKNKLGRKCIIINKRIDKGV